jgi:hypothetical protein
MAIAVAPYTNPRLAVVDARITKEVDAVSLNDAERRQRARQMILEAFAERPAVAYGSSAPELPVVAGREVLQPMSQSVGGAKIIDVTPEKPPHDGR